MIFQGENVVCPECKSFDLIKKGRRKTLTGASQRFKCLSCSWAGSGVVKSSGVGRVHAMIPDTQVTPDTPTDHLEWIGHYLAEIRPDVIVHIGDHADMESLSSYDRGKKASEGAGLSMT